MTCCASCLRLATSLSCPACMVLISCCSCPMHLSLSAITPCKSAICFSYLAGLGSWNNAPILSTAFVVASTATPLSLSVLISRRVCANSVSAFSNSSFFFLRCSSIMLQSVCAARCCAWSAAISTVSVFCCSFRFSICSAISFFRTNTSR